MDFAAPTGSISPSLQFGRHGLAASPAKAACRGHAAVTCRDLTLSIPSIETRTSWVVASVSLVLLRGLVRRAVDRGGRPEDDRRRSRRRALGAVARKLAGLVRQFRRRPDDGTARGPLRRPHDRDLRRGVGLHRALHLDARRSSGSSISATACSSGCSAPPASMRRSMSMSAAGSTAAAARRSRCSRAGSISPARSGRRSSSAPSPISAGAPPWWPTACSPPS